MVFHLSDHKINCWKVFSNVKIRGWYEKDGCIYNEISGFENMEIQTEEQFQQQLLQMNGNFALIQETETHVYLAVDRICSFPLYYAVAENGELHVSDNLKHLTAIVGKHTSEQGMEELLTCGYVLNNQTVYKNIYQLQGGQMLICDLNSHQIQIKDYFLHRHHVTSQLSPEGWCIRLEKTIENIIQRMVKSINNKQIVLFLSGGYDSKLIASYLKKINYENLICVSLGGMDTKDVSVAKEIAHQLDLPWVRVDVSKEFWRECKKSGEIDLYYDIRANHPALPYLQGYVLKKLIENGTVQPNCVAITGNSGDAIEGADVTHAFLPGRKYSGQKVADAISSIHFVLNGVAASDKLLARFDLAPYADKLYSSKTAFTDEEAEEIVEFFNWRERQCKYVINDVRNYDEVIGVEWRLPLWDNEFVDFWLSVPYELRYDRALYYLYVKGESLPSANTISFPRKCLNAAKKLLGKITYPLYFPKTIFNYLFSTKFYFAPFGLIDWNELWDILRTTKGYRKPHMAGIVRQLIKKL